MKPMDSPRVTDTASVLKIKCLSIYIKNKFYIIMKLTLYMIRHGLSCCNILHHKELRLNVVNALHKDPLLTTKGVEQSKRAGTFIKDRLPEVDIVFSSALFRAIETSHYMFPGKIINVCPYICEKRPSLENFPYHPKNQLRRIKEYIKDLEMIDFPLHAVGISGSSLKKFIEYIIENYTLENKCIAVVTHSNFLVDILGLEKRMNNNAVYKVIVDTDDFSICSHECIFSGYSFPEHASLRMAMR